MPADPINATPGDAAANSYATLAEAGAYHNNHPYGASWFALTADQQTQGLITATRLIDEQFEWPDGISASLTQVLMWPMRGMFSRSGYFGEVWGGLIFRPGMYIPDNIIPSFLRNATAEFARQLLVADRTADNDVETAGIRHLTAGPVSIDFFGNGGRKVVPDAVANLLYPWGRLRSRSVSRLVRA